MSDMPYKRKDHTGLKYHHLTAIKFLHFQPRVRTAKGSYRRQVWLFRCDCGNEKAICSDNVTRTKDPTKSCGCLTKHHKRGIDAVVNQVFGECYNDGDLTFDWFKYLAEQPCFYCDAPPSNTRTMRGQSWTYNGIDRLDSSQPHNVDNCVPACWTCNERKKADSLPRFLEWIQAVYLNRIAPALQP